MGNTRALLASMGASVTLVAAAAVALLVVSALLAAGGGGGDLQPAAGWPALILGGSAGSDPDISASSSKHSAPTPVVLRLPPRRERPVPSRPEPAIVAAPAPRAMVQPSVRRSAALVPAPPRPLPSPVASVRPHTGDAVRRIGDDLSSTVRRTGATLADAAAPLGPPVSQAVQDVLDGLAIVLERTTERIGGTLDKILPPKK